MYRLFLLLGLLSVYNITYAGTPPTDLELCQAKTGITGITCKFSYTEPEHRTYHSPRPWMTMERNHTGMFWVDDNSFSKVDTITVKNNHYVTKEYYTGTDMLYLPYYSKTPIKIDSTILAEEVYEIAKYHPNQLLNYFLKHKPATDGSTYTHRVYSLKIADAYVDLHIGAQSMLDKIVILKNEDVFGDVAYEVSYKDYTKYGPHDRYYAQTVLYKKVNDITDTIKVHYEGTVTEAPTLIVPPSDYHILPKNPEPEYKLITHKVNEHIYMLECTQAESAATLVVFNDFCMVIDAPLNSINGELVWQEVQKIAPDKPIKYYAYGHHHPWYLGGVRPFIFRGTTILTRKENIPYINYIAAANHALQPDSMRWHAPIKPLTQTYDDKKVITDGNYEVVLYHIGEQSQHTEDYTLFYFPKEKMLLEDDLVFIAEDKPLRQAGGKQKGLYDAIQDLKLDVVTIMQTWPWGGEYHFKTTIPYSELEETVQIANEEKK